MAFPCKDYNRFKSLRKKWGFSQEDMFYAMENAMFRVCSIIDIAGYSAVMAELVAEPDGGPQQ